MPLGSLSFISNASIVAASRVTLINCAGEGPIRLAETSTTWRVLLVNDSVVLAVLFELDKTATGVDPENGQPVYRIQDFRE